MAQYVSHIFKAHRYFLPEAKMRHHDWDAVQPTKNHTCVLVTKIDYHPEPFGVASIVVREFKLNAIGNIVFGHSSSLSLSAGIITRLLHAKA
jgi:hypothetical protein